MKYRLDHIIYKYIRRWPEADGVTYSLCSRPTPSDNSVMLPPGLICVRSETGDKNRRPARALVGRFMIIYTRACDRWGSTYTLRQIIMMNFPAPATPEVRSILIPYRTLPGSVHFRTPYYVPTSLNIFLIIK
uniref:Uncharacterized protein n=1 Tax=Morchella brunnea TaxID=1174671 RepID=A0A8K1I7Z9_9PEZI|nr:hypothetical protein LK370_mgp069 [Morchella brunnea]UBU98571.1 hypothetical protein [Morchella brunnea]